MRLHPAVGTGGARLRLDSPAVGRHRRRLQRRRTPAVGLGRALRRLGQRVQACGLFELGLQFHGLVHRARRQHEPKQVGAGQVERRDLDARLVETMHQDADGAVLALVVGVDGHHQFD